MTIKLIATLSLLSISQAGFALSLKCKARFSDAGNSWEENELLLVPAKAGLHSLSYVKRTSQSPERKPFTVADDLKCKFSGTGTTFAVCSRGLIANCLTVVRTSTTVEHGMMIACGGVHPHVRKFYGTPDCVIK